MLPVTASSQSIPQEMCSLARPGMNPLETFSPMVLKQHGSAIGQKPLKISVLHIKFVSHVLPSRHVRGRVRCIGNMRAMMNCFVTPNLISRRQICAISSLRISAVFDKEGEEK